MDLDQDEMKQLSSLRARKQAVRDAVNSAYGKAFDMLDAEIDLATAIGQLAIGYQYRPRRDAATFAAISRLHASVVLTAHEVMELLRAGFAAGATARWRTLYERAVVGHFISAAGEDTAARYLERAAVQLYRLAVALEEAEPGSMRTENQLEILNTRVAELTHLHGDGFIGDYGWAGLALSGRRTDKGTFSAVEKQTPTKEDRVFYRMASQEVHSGTYGPVAGSIPYAPDYLLLGPTPYQLAGTGQATAKWVYFSAAAVVAHASAPPEHRAVAARQLNGMAARCKNLAEEAHDMLALAETKVGNILEDTLASFAAPPPLETEA